VNLYLDVDGVLYPMSARGTSDFTDWVDADFFTFSPDMVARLGALDVTTHWLTTWRGEANDVLCPSFGWEPLPVLERRREALWWKLEALTAAQRSDEPFVWIDDELNERRRSSNGIVDAILDRFRAPYLLVSPDLHVGLSITELASVEAFVALHA
jgi:hypothetical protein